MSPSSASTPCPAAAQLGRYVDGALPHSESLEIQAHLERCQDCRWLCSTPGTPARDSNASADALWTAGVRPTLPGTMLDRYRVEGEIGRGGMGIVLRGFDTRLDREVAIKCVHVPLAIDHARWTERFHNEAQVLAAVADEHVVKLFDIGESDGVVFIVMELVRGESLRRWCQGRQTAQITGMLGVLARAIDTLHSGGWIHGDIKPDNVMVTTEGRLRLLDFGLARALHSSAASTAARAPGTPAYMAPELRLSGVATPQTDQYAWGVTAFEMLTGARPSPAMTTPRLHNPAPHRSLWPKPHPASRVVRAAVERALHASPQRRHATMDRAAAALRGRGWSWAALAAIPAAAMAFLLVSPGQPPLCLDPLLAAQPRDDARFDREAKRWSASWAQAAANACADTTNATEAAARQACLQSVGREFRSLTSGSSPVEESERVGLLQLPDPADCATPDSGLRRGLPQAPAAIASQVQDARDALATIRNGLLRGDNEAVVQDCEALEADVEALDFPPLLADVRLLRARAEGRLRRFEDARASLQRAVVLAEGAGDDELATEVWLARVSLEGRQAHDHTAAASAIRFADASLERSGRPPSLVAKHAMVMGAYYSEIEDDRRASAALNFGVERVRELHGDDSLQYAEALNILGAHRARIGATAEAELPLRMSTEIYAGRLGPTSRKVGNLLVNRANLALIRHDPPAARALGMQALAILEENSNSRDLANSIMGAAFSFDNRPGDAMPYLRAVLGSREKTLGADHPFVLASRIELATALRRLGAAENLEEAATELARARAYASQQKLPQLRSRLNLEQGLLDLARGHRESAARHCRLALEETTSASYISAAQQCVAEIEG